jgi:hypothetical protein
MAPKRDDSQDAILEQRRLEARQRTEELNRPLEAAERAKLLAAIDRAFPGQQAAAVQEDDPRGPIVQAIDRVLPPKGDHSESGR